MEVPWSHHSNSTIVCSLSGKIMNEDNPPMAFPNGYVYSKEVSGHVELENKLPNHLIRPYISQALQDMAAKSGDGMVKCPRTGFECEYSTLKKVFIS